MLAPGPRFILPWSAPRQMSSFYEFRVVHHPETSKVVFIPDKAFVQGKVGADGVLWQKLRHFTRGKIEGCVHKY